MFLNEVLLNSQRQVDDYNGAIHQSQRQTLSFLIRRVVGHGSDHVRHLESACRHRRILPHTFDLALCILSHRSCSLITFFQSHGLDETCEGFLRFLFQVDFFLLNDLVDIIQRVVHQQSFFGRSLNVENIDLEVLLVDDTQT